MAKHKVKKKSSRDRDFSDSYTRVKYARERSYHRSRDRPRDRPRGRSRKSSQHSPSEDSWSSRESSSRRSQSKVSLQETLDHIREPLSKNAEYNLNSQRAREVRSTSRDLRQVEEVSVLPLAAEPLVVTQSDEGPTVTNTDRGVVPVAPAFSAVRDDDHATASSVSFVVPPAEIVEPQDSMLDSEALSLASELFGETESPTAPSTWNQVLDAIQAETRKGLSQDSRTKLLAKYEVKGDLTALAPPKLNKELAAVLTQLGCQA